MAIFKPTISRVFFMFCIIVSVVSLTSLATDQTGRGSNISLSNQSALETVANSTSDDIASALENPENNLPLPANLDATDNNADDEYVAVLSTSCANAPNFSVSTEAELNAAISCYNSMTNPGVYQINFNSNVMNTGEVTQISNATPEVELFVNGNGYILDNDRDTITGQPTIYVDQDTTVGIDSLTIQNGLARVGGAIFNVGTLTLNNSTIQLNDGLTGGGIYNDGHMTITDTAILGNTADEGGGIYNFKTLDVINTHIANNRATYGGGIYDVGEMILKHSWIDQNVAYEDGGGVFSGDQNSQPSILVNSTITRNAADGSGGGLYLFISTSVSHLTVSDNAAAQGGGLYIIGGAVDDEPIFILNSIIANSSAGGDCFADGLVYFAIEIFEPATNNLIQDGSCDAIANGQLTGDPMLGALQNNGGVWQTMALLEGSPAIDQGVNDHAIDPQRQINQSPAVRLETDQRGAGFPRMIDGIVDLGAYETNPYAGCPIFPITVSTEAELNVALECYNEIDTSGTYEITLAADITLTGETPVIDNAVAGVRLRILGNDFTIDGADQYRIFTVAPESDLDIRYMRVTNGRVTGTQNEANGGAIFNEGNLTIFDSVISSSNADSQGGGIYNTGSLLVSSTEITDNEALLALGIGGGIYSSGNLTVEFSVISGNQASALGGGITNDGGTFRINRSIVRDNRSAIGGAGLANGGDGTITSSLFSSNIDDSLAGAIFHSQGRLNIVNSTIANNEAGISAGAIYSSDDLYIISTTVAGNIAPTRSGIVTEDYTPPIMVLSTVENDPRVNNLIFVNSIIADHANGDCTFTSDEGTVTFLANNLIEDGSCGAAATGQLTGDPMLGQLADNGDHVQTMALLDGSPAIDAGDFRYLQETLLDIDFDGYRIQDDEYISTDQRRYRRIDGVTVDLGAYEHQLDLDVECTSPMNVSTEEQLNNAIYCANNTFGSPIPVINVVNDIILTKPLYHIQREVEINGDANNDGIRSAISGDGAHRIFVVNGDLTLQSIILENAVADYGGAVHSYGGFGSELNIFDTSFLDNMVTVAGGAIYSANTTRIQTARFERNESGGDGGAYYSGGPSDYIVNTTFIDNQAAANGGALVTVRSRIERSTFDNNEAFAGGAIFVTDSVDIYNATFFRNSAMGYQDESYGGGGALFVAEGARLDSYESTFSENAASQGAVVFGQTSSDLGQSTSMSFQASILANSQSTTACSGNSSAPSFSWTNIVDDGSCGQGSMILAVDPLLGSLSDNGGATRTIPLLTNSPAIDAADFCFVTIDQRGVTRPQGDSCDLGAFEVRPSTCPAFPISVSTEAELNVALGCFNELTERGTYEIDFAQSIELTANATSIQNYNEDVSLQVNGNGYILDGKAEGSPLNFNISGILTLDDLTVQNARNGAPAISGIGDLVITNSLIHQNTGAYLDGYGQTPIFVSPGDVTIINTVVEDNDGGQFGAALWVNGNLKMVDSVIRDNRTLVPEYENVSGYAVQVWGTDVEITNSLIADNDRGGLSLRGATVEVSDTTIVRNGESGVIVRGDVLFRNNTVADNGSTGLYHDSGNLILLNSTIYNNADTGVGISNIYSDKAYVVNTTISHNATGVALPYNFSENVPLQIINSLIANNTTADCNVEPQWLTFAGINLIEDGSCDAVANGQLTGDPLLDILADNGGATQTMAPLEGSIALDAGDDSYLIETTLGLDYDGDGYVFRTLATDQRGLGFPRVQGLASDLGAYESPRFVGLVAPLNVTLVETGSPGIELTWEDTNSAETAYLIERSSDEGEWEIVAELPADTTIWQTTDLECFTEHVFRVSAYSDVTRTYSEPVEADVAAYQKCNWTIIIDENTTITEALEQAALSSGNIIIYVPAGYHIFETGRWLNPGISLRVIGDGSGQTTIDGFTLGSSGSNEIALEGLRLVGQVRFNFASNIGGHYVFEDVFIDNPTNSGGNLVSINAQSAVVEIIDSRVVGSQSLSAVIRSIGRNVRIVNSEFRDNFGQAVYLGHMREIQVLNSTFSNNGDGYEASLDGTALSIQGSDHNITIRNSTFSGNGDSGDSAINLPPLNPTILLEHITLVGSDYAFTFPPVEGLTIRNSIIRPDVGFFKDEIEGNEPQPVYEGVNIMSGDPLLEPLANYGGDTSTHALGLDSPALDAIPIDDCTLTTDQRGEPRPLAEGCDVGAVEGTALMCSEFPITVSSEAAWHDAIDCYNAQTVAGTYTIEFAADIVLTAPTQLIEGAGDLTINGNDYALDGGNQYRPLHINDTVIIRNLTIQNGLAHNDDDLNDRFGGAILNRGLLIVEDSMFINNESQADGGAIFNATASPVTIRSTQFIENTGGLGGAIYGTHTTLTIEDSSFEANTAGQGGALSWWGGAVTIRNSTFEGNQSQVGGALDLLLVDQFLIEYSTINDNHTAGFGGGIYVSDSNALIKNTTISNNTALRGGGVFQDDVVGDKSVVIVNSTLAHNSASQAGGGFHVKDEAYLVSATLSGNESPLGSNVYSELAGIVTLTNTILADAVNGADCEVDNTGQINFIGNNLVEDGSCDAEANGQLTGDPLLGELLDNGGATHTMALVSSDHHINPAHHGGDNVYLVEAALGVDYNGDGDTDDTLDTDQRGTGFSRLIDARVDLGAYELDVLQYCEFSSIQVSTAAHLDQAILCYNMFIDEPGTYTIEVTADIAINANVQFVDQTNPDVFLLIDGNGYTLYGSAFNIQSGHVTFENITMANSPAPASAIDNSATVIVSNSTINGTSGVINRDGAHFTANNVTFSNNYGALLNEDDGTIVINASEFIDNRAAFGDGGVIVNYGLAHLDGVTIAGSYTSLEEGAAIFSHTAMDKGFYLSNSTITNNAIPLWTIRASGKMVIINSTITDNESGIYNWVGNTTLIQSTVANNEGFGIYNDQGDITLVQNIFSNVGADCDYLTDAITFIGSNIIADGSCNAVSRGQFMGDPRLDVLADNGGTTQTMALRVGSIAIDAGKDIYLSEAELSIDFNGDGDMDDTLDTDQRGIGFPRVIGASVGLGAYEFDSLANCPSFPNTVTTETDLNKAIGCYNGQTVPGTYTINLAADILLTGDTTHVKNTIEGIDLVINGNDYAIDGNTDYENDVLGYRQLYIDKDTNVTLNDLIVRNGYSLYGAIVSGGNLIINNSLIDNNVADKQVGGIQVAVGNFEIYDSVISNNSTRLGTGGLIIVTNGEALIRNTDFINNVAESGGGAIYTALATVTIEDSFFIGNVGGSGGAIDIWGSTDVTIRDTLFHENEASSGGAISTLNSDSVTIIDSRFEGNTATWGGAILQEFGEIFIIQNSTFDNNSADKGGAIAYSNVEEAIYLINSTLVNNTATEGGAIYADVTNFGEPIVIVNSTISGNEAPTGANLFAKRLINFELINSIVANGVSGADCVLGDRSTMTFLGLNLIEDGSCDAEANGQLTGDPMLDVLADNGGATQTMALLAGSPALDAGDNSYLSEATLGVDYNGDGDTSDTLDTDQRGVGFPRVSGAQVDLGAYEWNVVVDCPAFPITVSSEAQLNEAIGCYNAQTSGGTYTINLAADILLTADTTQIDNAVDGIELVINGNDYAIDGATDYDNDVFGYRPFNVGGNADVTLNNIIIRNGYGDDGGGIISLGALEISGSIIENNVSTNAGGGISHVGERFAIHDSIIRDNRDLGMVFGAGGLYLSAVDSHISNTQFLNNTSVGSYGGGLTVIGNILLEDSYFEGNSADVGGAITIWFGSSETVIRNTHFVQNQAESGGAIFNQAYNNLVITNSTFDRNIADWGGALWMQFGDTFIRNTHFVQNQADEGGAIDKSNDDNNLTIIDSTFYSNSASVGGAINTNEGDGDVYIVNSSLHNNSAAIAGALNLHGLTYVVSTTLSGNDAIDGANIYGGSASNVMLVNSILANAVQGDDCVNDGAITFLGLNLIEDGSCDAEANGQLTGDPMLGALQDNGGATQTRAVLAGSPVIDAGDNSYLSEATLGVDYNGDGDTDDTLDTDQRGVGFPRVIRQTDLGAFEGTNTLPDVPPVTAMELALLADGFEITWTNENTFDLNFILERRAGTNTWTEVAQLPAETTAYTDGGLGCDETFEYRLFVYRLQDRWLSTAAEISGLTLPCIPQNLAVDTVTADSVTISFTGAPYINESSDTLVEVLFDGDDRWRRIAQVPNAETTFTLEGLQCDTTFTFRLLSLRPSDEAVSPPSTEVMATTSECVVAPPENLTTANLQADQVTLMWDIPAMAYATHWVIERQVEADGWVSLGMISVSEDSYVDYSLMCGTNYMYRLKGYNERENAYSTESDTVNVTTPACPINVTTVVGQYNGASAMWSFNEQLDSSSAVARFRFGPASADAQGLVGDWNGDGTEGIAVYLNGVVVQRNLRNGGAVDHRFTIGSGQAGWQAIAGDFDGDGIDTIALYKDGMLITSNENNANASLERERLGDGQFDWQAIAGDFTGDGIDSVALYRNGIWFMPDVGRVLFGSRQLGWQGIVGDWNGNGVETIGVNSGNLWRLRNSNAAGTTDLGFTFGVSSDDLQPLVYTSGVAPIVTLSMLPPDFTQPTEEPVEVPPEPTEAPVEITPEPTEVPAEVTPEPTEGLPEATPEPTEVPVEITPEPTEVPAEITPEPTEGLPEATPEPTEAPVETTPEPTASSEPTASPAPETTEEASQG